MSDFQSKKKVQMPDLAERPPHDPAPTSARPDPADSGTELAQTTEPTGPLGKRS